MYAWLEFAQVTLHLWCLEWSAPLRVRKTPLHLWCLIPIFSVSILSRSPRFSLHHHSHLRQHALRNGRGHAWYQVQLKRNCAGRTVWLSGRLNPSHTACASDWESPNAGNVMFGNANAMTAHTFTLAKVVFRSPTMTTRHTTLHPAPPLRPRHSTPRGPCAILGHWRWLKSDVGGPHKACCLDCLVSAGSWLSHLAEIDGNRIRKTCRIEGRKTCRTWNREHFTVEVRPVFEIGRISGIWQDFGPDPDPLRNCRWRPSWRGRSSWTTHPPKRRRRRCETVKREGGQIYKYAHAENNLELMENRLSSSGRFSQALRPWKSSKKSENRIIFMSMFNDIDWTRRGNSEECISSSEQVKNYAEKFTQGHWTFLGPGSDEMWYGKSNYPPEGKWQETANMMVGTIRGIWTSSTHKCSSTGSWNPEEEEQQGDHTLQCGCFEYRTFISNNSLCKSAQYLRSSRTMVWRFWYEDWRKVSENFTWWDVERISTKRSDFCGKSTKECPARSWKRYAWSSTEVRNTVNRSPM